MLIKTDGMTLFDIFQFHVSVENLLTQSFSFFGALLKTAKIQNLSKNSYVWALKKQVLVNSKQFLTPH